MLRVLVAAGLLGSASAGSAATTYLTNFAKTSGIYTNLNEEYPNAGPGVPGSRTVMPNSTVLFAPQATGVGNPNNLNYVNNGIGFTIASNADGHDFAEIGSASFGLPSLTLAVGLSDVDHLYLLMGAYNGVSFNITLTGSNGATQTFNNISLPDFNGGSINSVGGGVADQTVFRVLDTGAGGTGNSTNGSYNYYDLTEVGLTLDPAFTSQTLTSATITSNGYETLLLGATATSTPSVGAVPEPAMWALMLVGFGLTGAAVRRRSAAAVTA